MNPALYKDPNLGMPPVREIVLHGELARKFGKVHRYRARSAAHALRYLCQMVPGFQREIGEAGDRGVAYQVWVNGKNIGKDEIKLKSHGRIYISPVLRGSKRAGMLETIIGIVLIVVGAFLIYTPAGLPLIEVGAALALGGVMQMLAPVPKQDKQNQLKSSFFDGPVNVTAQGNPVPLLYGRMICGSAVISGGITIDDAAASGAAPTGTGGGGGDGGRQQWHNPALKPN